MIDAGDVELKAVRAEFSLLIARWRLTQAELQSLLGADASEFTSGRVLPDVLDRSGETRLRLLLRLDVAFQRLGLELQITSYLRGPAELNDEISLLDSLSNLQVLRRTIAMVESAKGLASIFSSVETMAVR
jgi:hypothetical protein